MSKNMKYIILILTFSINTAWAIDNPDAPDYVAEFESRIQPYENYVRNKASATYEFSKGYDDLYYALDRELNAAYKNLIAKLPKDSKNKLKISQNNWIIFRDSEFSFISENFNRASFGSSSTISRGSYRASILKARIIELLWYLKNYS